MIRAVVALVAAAVVAGPVPGGAHTTSTGLATLTVSGAMVTYRLTLALAELGQAPRAVLSAAVAGDRAAAEAVADLLHRHVAVRADAAPCRPGRVVVQGSGFGESRVSLSLELACAAGAARLTLRDDWPDLLGPHHRTVVRVEGDAGDRELVLTSEDREATLPLVATGGGSSTGFFTLGVEHILTGWDHLLFVAALLLGGGGLGTLLKIVTAFTVAHSVTLGLAGFGLLALPARAVESVIAASIAWVAIDNLRTARRPARRWQAGFAFGLVHGAGFAAALGPLGLPPVRLAWALLGFNLGVEAGQALVIGGFLPVLLGLRWLGWETATTRACSVALALVGAGWFVQRIFLV